MKFDAKAVTAILVTAFLGTCAVLLVLHNDVKDAFTFGALLVPSAGQILNGGPKPDPEKAVP